MKANRRTASAARWLLRVLAACAPLLLAMPIVQGQTIPGTIKVLPLPGTEIPGVPPNGVGKASKWTGYGWGDPGTAGCHTEVPNDPKKAGRVFGEKCMPYKDNGAYRNGIIALLETTPGHGGAQPHTHANDEGHPLLIDCAKWCAGPPRKGPGPGKCVTLPAKSAKNACSAPSAICDCN